MPAEPQTASAAGTHASEMQCAAVAFPSRPLGGGLPQQQLQFQDASVPVLRRKIHLMKHSTREDTHPAHAVQSK
jgi:hypothetical protein